MGRVVGWGLIVGALVAVVGCGGDDEGAGDEAGSCAFLTVDAVEAVTDEPVELAEPAERDDGCDFLVGDDNGVRIDVRPPVEGNLDAAADQAIGTCEDGTEVEVDVGPDARAFACVAGQPNAAYFQGDTLLTLRWTGGYDDEAVPRDLFADLLPAVTVP